MNEISAERFIVIWQTSKTKAEVLERVRRGPKVVESRARYFRQHGVKLKYFTMRGARDWKQLSKLALEVAR